MGGDRVAVMKIFTVKVGIGMQSGQFDPEALERFNRGFNSGSPFSTWYMDH